MTRYVIGPAIRLAHDQAVIPHEHHILAPTLLRSQMVSLLYQAAHRGEMIKKDAEPGLSTTCAGCGSDCSEIAFFRPSLGRSPTSSGGRTPLTLSLSM
jgi:hypothetical protein